MWTHKSVHLDMHLGFRSLLKQDKAQILCGKQGTKKMLQWPMAEDLTIASMAGCCKSSRS
jgi:hypothetical protein